MTTDNLFVWRGNVAYILFCIIVLFESVTVGAKPRGHNRMNSDAPEVTVRRETVAHSPSELIRLRDVVDQLASTVGHVSKDVQELKSEMHGEIKKLKDIIRPLGRPEMKCRTSFTRWAETIGFTLEYLDSFDVHCPHGEFLRQWRMTWGERGNQKAIRYVCCRFTYNHNHQRAHLSGHARSHQSGRGSRR